jgi:hypothetical protein
VEARAAGRAKVGLAISVTNARAAISAFIYLSMFVDIRDLPATEQTDALCLLFRTEIGSAYLPNEIGSAPRSASYIFGFIG